MVLSLFSIRDIKASQFLTPFYSQNVSLASRECHSTVNSGNPENVICKYPEDFELYEIGQFDSDTGKIVTSVEGIKFITNLSTFKEIR